MLRRIVLVILILSATSVAAASEGMPVWPPAPDTARVEFVGEIRCRDLKPSRGFVGSLARLIGGRGSDTEVRFPFDVVSLGERLYLTCQEIPALVELDPASMKYRLHGCDSRPFENPLALCTDGEVVYISDGGSRSVYRFDGDTVTPLIVAGLERPTGLAFVEATGRLHVVDTGSHCVDEFDRGGALLGKLGGRGDVENGFNYPTFISAHDGLLLVNDTLNYRIKVFMGEALVATIGREGDGPGAFARPKGLAVDARGYIYVVDSLFDNVQIFDRAGRLLLVIGTPGNAPGEFWSPAGIDIDGDLIYVADTFNHRIQILRTLGG